VIEGFRYLAPRRVLLVSFLADIIAMVFGMPRALFPELAQRTFSAPLGSSVALGILYAAIPIGAVIGGIFSGAFTRIRRQGAGVVVAVIAWGVAVVAFGLAPNLWMAVLFLALGGAADLVSMVLRNSILQSAAVDEMRGRMQGVSIVVVSGGPRLADLLHGTAGAVLGPNVTIAAGGILTVLAMLLVAAILPAFWAYKPPAETAAQPTQPAEVDSAPERTDLSPH
jgi:MFS family permease